MAQSSGTCNIYLTISSPYPYAPIRQIGVSGTPLSETEKSNSRYRGIRESSKITLEVGSVIKDLHQLETLVTNLTTSGDSVIGAFMEDYFDLLVELQKTRFRILWRTK